MTSLSDEIIDEKMMNDKFVEIWESKIKGEDSEIIKRLKNGEINSEMDVQAIYRVEMEKREMIGHNSPLWGCYYNILLSEKGSLYDLALMKYETDGKYDTHYPAIVAEFKLWKPTLSGLKQDCDKLQDLTSDKAHLTKYPTKYKGKPYARHIMYIIDITNKNLKEKWREEIWKRGEGWEFSEKSISPIEEIMKLKIQKCQCGRYGDRSMSWKPSGKGFPINRELWQIRLTKIR